MKLSKTTLIGSLAVAGGLAAGGLAGLAWGMPGVSGAQEAPPASAEELPGGRPGRGAGVLDAALDELVADGTLTQEQADAVRGAVRAQAGDLPGPRGWMVRGVETAAGVLGLEPEQVVERLRGGETLAQIAQAQGVDPQAVIDALVAEANARVDQALAGGRITQERADTLKAAVPERVTRFVNEGRQHHGGRGPGGGTGGGMGGGMGGGTGS
ncbi:MAG: hypothetical protein IPM45_04390 [Acidimicrobiales bacterium]|nr:hypothetical protein [Acidimicrobiales bacterium]